ncbi:MAG: hypothetical protein A2494_03275 [Candidatus Lloydbacteria bacterium RIFOXYC12_FULL_46_25]|uniref:Uncharacterized protein n=1 Tax=Candidatus Lloydbacteria bacterium RIFOXYC12_FULL_46_25 TaxID=1798670 RepID=A0A1G2DWY4_9BACT|nr:MAG: hypothetical protein A2494_03275 [Candidatus Lloydbacteria bacterium RIFOXYC12_FULL_46_25]
MNKEAHCEGVHIMNVDIPNLRMYLADFASAIKDIDERIFHSIGKPYCEIILLDRFPGPEMPGSHIAKLVTFTTKIPIIYSPSVLMFPVKQEYYIIWGVNVSERLHYLLKRDALSGVGDKDIKEIWFMMAIALARLRVLARGEWFPGVRLRTRKSVSCHRELFADGADEVGALRRLLFEFDSNTQASPLVEDIAVSVDIYWTLRLVARALERGCSLEGALRFVAYD